MARWKQIRLVSIMMWDVSSIPGLVQGLRIQRGCELWCRSQMRLRSGTAMAVAVASSCNSKLTPSPGTSICPGCGPKT